MTPRVRRSPVPPSGCNLARAIELIGDRWTLMVLRSALYGVRRFDDFQAELKCPRTVLSGRLKTLTEAGLLERRSYQESGKRTRPEYVLTDRGAELRAALVALTQWGDAHLAGGEPAPVSFVDEETRSPVRAGFVDADGRSVDPNGLRAVLRR
ncbi:MAG: helix-turn-helix domain-containing protein [Pseudomonadota bacterium]